MTRLVLTPVGGYWTWALVALGLSGLWLWSQRGVPVGRRRAHTLSMLRLSVILLVLAVLLRPTLVYTHIERQPATLVVLLDGSRSMLVADAAGNRTRWDELRRTMEEAWPTLGALGKDLDVKVYDFDRSLRPHPFDPNRFDLVETPQGEQTGLGAALADVLEREGGQRIAAIVIASDGAQRALPPREQLPQTVVRRLADQGVSLYAVAFGQPRGLGQTRDVAVKDLAAARSVFVKNELTVDGAVEVDGFPGQTTTVELLFETAPGKMTVVDSTTVKVPEQSGRAQVSLRHIPETPGEFKVMLRAAPQAGELVTTNNDISTFVTVLSGGLRVLYLEGIARHELRFLRRSLDASPDIQLDFLRLNAQAPETRPADFAANFERGKYDVYLIGDLDSAAFEPAELESLAERVEEGAGLMMLGGYHSFGPGGYYRTKLNDVLPIFMERTERQDFDAPIVADLHLSGEVQVQPTPGIGAQHPTMSLGPRETNAVLWAQLPPLEGANRFRRLKPGAVTLAQSQRGEPLLVSKDYGLGRVLAFAGDSTWQWATSGHGDAHRRFWRQIILWLARKDEAAAGSVWIKLAERRFSPASRVEFTVGALDENNLEVTGAEFTAKVITPTGKSQAASLASQGDQAIGAFLDTLAPGDYTIEVTGTKAGQSLGVGRARFLVYAQDLELDNPAADPAALGTLAEMTPRGRKLPPEQLSDLLRELQERTAELEIANETKSDLWDNWGALALFVILLAVEWYLRKRWGLV